MATLYLIAHAHTRQIPDTDARGWSLDHVGQQQAVALAQQPFWERVERILLSNEHKTRLTIEPLLQARALPVHEDDRFDELHRTPEWTYNYAARVAAVFRWPEASIAGWEPAVQALARFQEGVAAWTARYPNGTFALVGHGLTFSLYRAHLLGLPRVALPEWHELAFAAVALVIDGRLIEDFAVPPDVPLVRRGKLQ